MRRLGLHTNSQKNALKALSLRVNILHYVKYNFAQKMLQNVRREEIISPVSVS